MKHSRRGICLIINVTITRDLFLFIRADSEKGAPGTVRSHALAVRHWFAENDIELSAKEKMRVRRVTPRGGRLTNIKYIDVGVLREILTLADIRIKAFILVAACTGARIGELRALTWSCVTFPDRKVKCQNLLSVTATPTAMHTMVSLMGKWKNCSENVSRS